MFVTFTEKKSARFHNWRYYSVFKGRMHSYNGKKIQTGPRAFIFGYVIDLPKSNNF